MEQCRRLELAVLTGEEPVPETPRAKPSLRERLLGGLLSGTIVGQSPGSTASPGWPSIGRPGQKAVQYRPDLPHGWEAKVDPQTGRTLYIDHVNRKTSWTLPDEKHATTEAGSTSALERKKSFRTRCKEEILATEAWSMLDATVDEVRRKVLPEALSSIAEVFLQNGDRNSFFYTGSQAMHSDKIMIFEPESSQLKKNSIGGASNSFIAITRRYNNILKDNDRQAQIELFLGINLEKYLLPQGTSRDLNSVNVVYKPKPVPQDTADTDDEDEPVNHIDYPTVGSTPVLAPAESVESIRSMSSPNLRQYEFEEGENAAVGESVDDDQIQMYSFEDEIRSMKSATEPSLNAEVSSSSPELAPGLRSISTANDPLT